MTTKRCLFTSAMIEPAAKRAKPDDTPNAAEKNDEVVDGMIVFNDLREFSSESHPDVQAAAESYNEALLFPIDSETRMAKCQVALNHLLPHVAGGFDTVAPVEQWKALVIKILYSLGQMAFQNQNSVGEAACFFEFALEQSSSHNIISKCTVAALNGLGVLAFKADRVTDSTCVLDTAKQLLLKVPIEKRGASHTTLSALVSYNLGKAHLKIGNLQQALSLFEESQGIYGQIFGRHSMSYAEVTFHIAHCLDLGNLDCSRALALYEEYVQLARCCCTDHNKSTGSQRSCEKAATQEKLAFVLSNMALICLKANQVGKATQYMEESVLAGRQVFCGDEGEESTGNMFALLKRAASFYFETQAFHKANKIFQEMLLILESGNQDCCQSMDQKAFDEIVFCAGNIAECYRLTDQLKLCIHYYKISLRYLEARFGEQSTQAAAALNLIGLLQEQNGEASVAIQTLERSLQIRRGLLGKDHADISATLLYIGLIHFHHKSTSKALDVLLEANQIYCIKHGQNDQLAINIVSQIAQCYVVLGLNRSAILFYRRSLEMLQRQPQTTEGYCQNKGLLDALTNLSCCHRDLEEMEEAANCLEQVYDIHVQRIRRQGEAAALVRTMDQLGQLYQQMGQMQNLKDLFVRTARIFREYDISVSVLQTLAPGNLVLEYALTAKSCAPMA